MSTPVSRPKIHRLPAVAPVERQPSRLAIAVLSYGNTAKFVFILSSAALGLILLALAVSRIIPGILRQDDSFAAQARVDVLSAPVLVSKSIVLRSENDVIIGQMARISAPTVPPPQISTMSSDVDKRKGRELLSIIGQY